MTIAFFDVLDLAQDFVVAVHHLEEAVDGEVRAPTPHRLALGDDVCVGIDDSVFHEMLRIPPETCRGLENLTGLVATPQQPGQVAAQHRARVRLARAHADGRRVHHRLFHVHDLLRHLERRRVGAEDEPVRARLRGWPR